MKPRVRGWASRTKPGTAQQAITRRPNGLETANDRSFKRYGWSRNGSANASRVYGGRSDAVTGCLDAVLCGGAARSHLGGDRARAGVIPLPGIQSLANRHPAAQSRSVGGDQAAPDTVLADVPVPQG